MLTNGIKYDAFYFKNKKMNYGSLCSVKGDYNLGKDAEKGGKDRRRRERER